MPTGIGSEPKLIGDSERAVAAAKPIANGFTLIMGEILTRPKPERQEHVVWCNWKCGRVRTAAANRMPLQTPRARADRRRIKTTGETSSTSTSTIHPVLKSRAGLLVASSRKYPDFPLRGARP